MARPKRPPLLVFFGRHKCATRYVSNILDACAKAAGASYVNISMPEPRSIDWTLRHLPPEVRILRASPYTSHIRRCLDTIGHDFRGFHLVRDPRDMVVSGYFSHRNSHPERWIFQKMHFAALRSLPFEDGLRREIDYTGWLEFDDMATWPTDDPRIVEMQFETLTKDPRSVFQPLLAETDLAVDAAVLARILADNRFENLSGGRRPGEEDTASHYRKGVPGDWVNHFSAANLAYFMKRYGGLLTKYGYPVEPPASSTGVAAPMPGQAVVR